VKLVGNFFNAAALTIVYTPMYFDLKLQDM